MWLKNGIFHYIYKPGLEIDLETAKQTVQDRLELIKGEAYPTYVDIRGLKKVDNNARSYLASPEATQLVSALAIRTGSEVQKVIANFYYKINKPVMPTRLFTDEGRAFRWLKLYQQQN